MLYNIIIFFVSVGVFSEMKFSKGVKVPGAQVLLGEQVAVKHFLLESNFSGDSFPRSSFLGGLFLE